ncbi:MAG: sigma 54-interacting transcriptional regulator [Bacillota bacterium]|nr:sigma 54-interacting transcriptional regulator [Bacillota bacterium]
MLPKDNKYWHIIEHYLDTILDMFNDPVIIIDKEGTIIYVNKGYELQVGIMREQVLGRNLKNKYPKDKLLEAIRTGELIINEEHYNETLGYSIVASFLPIKDHNGETIAVAGIGTTSPVYKLNLRLSPIHSLKHKKPSNNLNRKNFPSSFNSIIGEAPKLLNCLSLSAQVAKSEATVMLRGETGVGKELFARAIHDCSDRCKNPFVAVNCAAIPENLIESELFGYNAGAFTGARTSGKMGKIEMAHKGTLFLDEIGDLSPSTQVKLLRFTQEKYLERIGGNEQIHIDVRIVTATNRNLEQMVQQGEFRADLYYRLNVIPIHIPPLRERLEDIGILAHYFLDYFTRKYNKKIGFSMEAMECLQEYHWPGNIRELKNIIEHAVIICTGNIICESHLNLYYHASIKVPTVLDLNQAVEYTEREIIKKALEKAFYNKSKAIKYLGISRGAFYAKLKKYKLTIP